MKAASEDDEDEEDEDEEDEEDEDDEGEGEEEDDDEEEDEEVEEQAPNKVTANILSKIYCAWSAGVTEGGKGSTQRSLCVGGTCLNADCQQEQGKTAGCINGFNQRSLCGERFLFECRLPLGRFQMPLLGSPNRMRLHQRFQSYHFVRMRKRAMRRENSQRRWLPQRFQSKITLW